MRWASSDHQLHSAPLHRQCPLTRYSSCFPSPTEHRWVPQRGQVWVPFRPEGKGCGDNPVYRSSDLPGTCLEELENIDSCLPSLSCSRVGLEYPYFFFEAPQVMLKCAQEFSSAANNPFPLRTFRSFYPLGFSFKDDLRGSDPVPLTLFLSPRASIHPLTL